MTEKKHDPASGTLPDTQAERDKRDKTQSTGGTIADMPGNQTIRETPAPLNQPNHVLNPVQGTRSKSARDKSHKDNQPKSQSILNRFFNWLSGGKPRSNVTKGSVVEPMPEHKLAEDIEEPPIPPQLYSREESKWLMAMEDELKRFIIGQDEAVEAISKAVRRWRTNTRKPTRPIGSFLLLGPTGVGKTHLTHMLAQFLFGDQNALLEFNMADFWEIQSTKKTNTPLGSIGYNFSSDVADILNNNNLSIVVFDKIENAPKDSQTMLQQIVERGSLQNEQGQTVIFRNSLVIMTTNVGEELIKRERKLGFSLGQDENTDEQRAYADMRKKLLDLLRAAFRKELINELDSFIVFRALSRQDIRKIIEVQLDEISEWLQGNNISLEATSAGLDQLAYESFDPEMGAPPSRRVIQLKVLDRISDAILGEQFKAGDTILIDVDPETEDIVLQKKVESSEEEPPMDVGV